MVLHHYQDSVFRAVRALSVHVDRLFSIAVRMELARNFLAAKVDWQENYISDLRSEVRTLKSLPGYLNASNISTMMNGGLSFCLVSPNSFNRSPSIARGDDVTSMQDSTLSRMSLPMVFSEEQQDKCIDENSLVEEILRVEDSIVRINSEITSKAASLLELDAAAESALTNIVSLEDHSDSWQDSDRVGRVRRRSGANRPRGRSTRTSGHMNFAMTMDKVFDKNLPSQGFRSLSGRREDPTVPEVPPSLSGEEPASSLPTGEEREMATVVKEVDRDPLDLTFVDCLSAIEVVPQSQNQEATIASTPIAGTKRKAMKISPDAPSEDEPGANTSDTQRVPRVVLRKLRTRKRKPKEVDDQIEEVSSASMSTDSDWNSERGELINEDSDLEFTGIQQLDDGSARKLRPKKKALPRKSSSKLSSTRKDSDLEVAPKKNVSQGSNKGKRKSRARRKSLTSSDDEDEDSNFAPEELRAMGATAAGSLGLECIDDVESERKNSPNINGQVSDRMKKKLKRAKKIINTLMYKAEASGDPALLRLKNRELTDKVQRLKLNEVVIKRELEDMRSLVDGLRKEISDLKDRVEEAEEDRRKSRESQRIMLWRHKKERGEVVCESPSS
ncbi:unnamed protein product [Lasius platythorax]|uniref:Uncharacterized protein n=1 Tax=Lasius platythorax TaxID=488582 RepID=A0AAV2NSZ3_9HYME